MMGRKTKPAHDVRRLRLGLHALELDAATDLAQFDAIEHPVEVEVPPGAAELAVGDASEPDLLLLADDFLDLGVLDRLQLGRADLAFVALGPGLLHWNRAQDAADVIGPEWRRGSHRHSRSPVTIICRPNATIKLRACLAAALTARSYWVQAAPVTFRDKWVG